MTPAEKIKLEQDVADKLHSIRCRVNHTDQCGWMYASWANPDHSRNKYLDRARDLLMNIPPDKILYYLSSIDSVLRGC